MLVSVIDLQQAAWTTARTPCLVVDNPKQLGRDEKLVKSTRHRGENIVHFGNAPEKCLAQGEGRFFFSLALPSTSAIFVFDGQAEFINTCTNPLTSNLASTTLCQSSCRSSLADGEWLASTTAPAPQSTTASLRSLPQDRSLALSTA